jgi:hypothetical protein
MKRNKTLYTFCHPPCNSKEILAGLCECLNHSDTNYDDYIRSEELEKRKLKFEKEEARRKSSNSGSS